jgi:hypothetical protein
MAVILMAGETLMDSLRFPRPARFVRAAITDRFTYIW